VMPSAFPLYVPQSLVHRTPQQPEPPRVRFTGPKRRPPPAGHWVAVGWVSPDTLVVEV